MTSRQMITTVTMLALGLVLALMAFVGFRWATAPTGISSSETPTSEPTACQPGETPETTFIYRKDVTVSVFNSGKRSGRAREVLAMLEDLGFRPGAVGNSPEGLETDRAVVYTEDAEDPAAILVARNLGKKVEVRTVRLDDVGPGVVVVIGDKFKTVAAKGPKRIEAVSTDGTCVP